MEQRRFPILLSPVQGETLASWLDRYCSELSTSRKDLYKGLGLRPLSPKCSPDHSVRVSEKQAASIFAATGIGSDEIEQLTLARYEGRALVFRGKREGVDARFLWARGSGSRYCPACLHEDPGVWKLAWRLSWSFACTKHSSLLLDDCLGCGCFPRSKPNLRDVPDLNLCGNAVEGSNGGISPCRMNLSQANLVHLPVGGSILSTQAWLENAIDSLELSADRVQSLLNDLRLLAGRALRVMSAEDLRRGVRSDQVPGLDFEVDPRRKHTSLPPSSAAAMATAVSLAAMVLRGDDEGVYLPVLRSLLSTDGGKVAKEFPSSFIRRWGEPSPVLQLKLLKALHPHLRPETALRYGTAGPAPAPPSVSQTQILERARSVPERFWPGWVHLLQLSPSVGPRILQTGLSLGVLLPGYDRPNLTLQRESLGLSRTDDSLSYVCRRLPSPVRDEMMRALSTLASYLDKHPAPIDYRRRRLLSLSGLLPMGMWRDLSHRKCGEDPTAARLYLTYRITGSIPEQTERGGDGYYLLQNFIASTPTGILDMLDLRARSLLAEMSVVEPLSWEPPKGLLWADPWVGQPKSRTDPVLESLIMRGLIEPRLISQIAEGAVKSVGALIPGSDSFEAELRRLLDRGESVERMAIALNRSRRMILHHLSRLGLPPPQGHKAALGAEELRDMYLVQRRTAQEIAKATGWDKNTIRRLLLVSGVKPREGSSVQAASSE